MTTPTTHIAKIQQAFQDLRDGLAGLETSLLDWTGDIVEHHHTDPVKSTPAEDDAPATPSPKVADAHVTVKVGDPVEPTEADSFPYSFEDVRQILGSLAKEGHKLAVQEALKAHGAKRLSDIDPVKYEALIDAARAKAAA